jgi:hypothetical protein
LGEECQRWAGRERTEEPRGVTEEERPEESRVWPGRKVKEFREGVSRNVARRVARTKSSCTILETGIRNRPRRKPGSRRDRKIVANWNSVLERDQAQGQAQDQDQDQAQAHDQSRLRT